MSLIAGIARVPINPLRPMTLFGYPNVPRVSTGVNDPLYATSLYLEDHHQALFFIGVDLLMLHHDILRKCRDRITQSTGIPASHILVSTTHTHSAPITMEMLAFRDDPTLPVIDLNYLEMVSNAIVDSSIQAQQNARPARIAFTSVDVHGVGCNRHDPQGPRDPALSIMLLKDQENNQPFAISLVYAMHPTVLHEDSRLVSADFPGYTRQILEEKFPGAIVLYQNGTCGNLSPRYHVNAQTFIEAKRLGLQLAMFAEEGIERLEEAHYLDEVLLVGKNAWITLPTRVYPSVAQAEQNLIKARDNFQHLKDSGAPHGPVRTAEVIVFGAEECVVLAKAQANGELDQLRKNYSKIEVQKLLVGEHIFYGLPGELFVEYGLEIKRRSQAPTTVISLANGELQGYIVTPGAEGYEANLSFFTDTAGQILVEAALGLV